MQAVSVMMMKEPKASQNRSQLFAGAHLRERWSIRIFLGCPSAAAAALVAAVSGLAAPSPPSFDC
jgi:hypothetical protein